MGFVVPLAVIIPPIRNSSHDKYREASSEPLWWKRKN